MAYRTLRFKANFHSSVLRAGRKKLLAQVNQLDAINMRGIRGEKLKQSRVLGSGEAGRDTGAAWRTSNRGNGSCTDQSNSPSTVCNRRWIGSWMRNSCCHKQYAPNMLPRLPAASSSTSPTHVCVCVSTAQQGVSEICGAWHAKKLPHRRWSVPAAGSLIPISMHRLRLRLWLRHWLQLGL